MALQDRTTQADASHVQHGRTQRHPGQGAQHGLCAACSQFPAVRGTVEEGEYARQPCSRCPGHLLLNRDQKTQRDREAREQTERLLALRMEE